MLFSFLSLIGLAVACADNELHARDADAHAHIHERREYPQVQLTPPYGPLVWGDFNVIHTTDTHGWLLGHQKLSWPEPNYSGDLGDFASFVTHMKQIAVERNVDLLLVDSGDLHDGTGLSDGYPAGGVDAHDSNEFLKRLPYDLMTIGNHELTNYSYTHDMYFNFVPHLKGRYLSSNANITIVNSDGVIENVPVGNRYTKFTTAKGRNVTSLGVLYDFKYNDTNTTVQTAANMVKEQWFAEAIAEEPDVFLLVGHIPVSNYSWPVVFHAIRDVHPYTPILIFGGHTHVRDCQQYCGRSMALESGRFMETIGWMSANLTAAKGNTNNITFSRRYLDQNRVTYQYHTATSNSTFDTPDGRNITDGLEQLAIDFDLGHLYGTARQDYTLNQNPYPSSGNALTLFIAEAAPLALAINNTRADIPNIIIANSYLLRFDIYNGSFTKNDQLSAVMYPDEFYYIPNVTASVANEILPAMNKGSCPKLEKKQWDHEYVETRYRSRLGTMGKRQQVIFTSELTPGYVTKDGCPGVGDDTPHTPLANFPLPHYIGSNPPDVPSNVSIDVVYIKYVEDDVLCHLNLIQTVKHYTVNDTSLYTHTLTNEVLGLYAEAKWN